MSLVDDCQRAWAEAVTKDWRAGTMGTIPPMSTEFAIGWLLEQLDCQHDEIDALFRRVRELEAR